MDYQQTLDFLYTRLPMYQRVGPAALKFNLDNTTKLMEALGNPQWKVKTVHVAGTNGKGSSSHMLASILQEAGYKTGLYTSPHLKSFTERIRINGKAIDETGVVDFVRSVKGLIETIKPSFFEITFAMAMQYFADKAVDIAIIEVGMGGRLDSTNIIHPEVCLITNISMDHQQFLGENLMAIAGEKAGIIKKGVPVVISQHQDEIEVVFKEKAAELNAPLIIADYQYFTEQAAENRLNVVSVNGGISYEGLKLDLKGDYQNQNMLGVLSVIEQLKAKGFININDLSIYNGLTKVIANTNLKGRWQILREQPLIIADTGHNIAGVKAIIEQLGSLNYERLHIVWGMVKDKDPQEILSLLPSAASYYFVQADIPRALNVDELMGFAVGQGLAGNSYRTVNEGLSAASMAANTNDVIFVGGSTFVVAEIEVL